jgi:hypothetical protein
MKAWFVYSLNSFNTRHVMSHAICVLKRWEVDRIVTSQGVKDKVREADFSLA